ncbi:MULTISPECIES: ATP-dependent nuclease [Xanthomonas]|nr:MULTISPECIES: AAA family ATPase [Xanthomonas]MCE4364968.1 AAA family ATPase [Xanthomonas hortorum]
MGMTSVKVKGMSCFTGDWCGFDEFKPLNIIIGRNNTGKSQLLSLVETLCSTERRKPRGIGYLRINAILEESHLRSQFHESTSSGAARGNHWTDNGARFVDTPMTWIEDPLRSITVEQIAPKSRDINNLRSPYVNHDFATPLLANVTPNIPYPFANKIFRHILADRDIKKEQASPTGELGPDGSGATNLIREYLINAEHISRTERLIQRDLRGALNEIFGPDGHFTRISVQQHASGEWEVFLEEERKGLVAMSRSGSGLKTVILVLLNLLVVPDKSGNEPNRHVYAFEELENNLHPSLLRRLLRYIERFALEKECSVFLTTHSSAALDQFRRADHAQFVRVSHDGQHASTQTISAHFDHSQVVGELGARASDILQANGIVWVEGPSDAIYLNHWIEIFSDGELIEGRDYACAFYGGSLLARTTFTAPGEQENDLVNLIPLNRHVALICDSDRSRKGAPLKKRVANAQGSLAGIPNAMTWITAGKEIETYLPGTVIGQALGLGTKADPDQFGIFFPSESPRRKGESYVEATLNLNAIDKVGLALAARPFMTKETMASRLDWAEKMAELVAIIGHWNS